MVGIKREQQKLNAAFQSKRAEFVGVSGRRRAGKTYLISESFAGNFVFRHAGLSPVEEKQKEAGLTEEGLSKAIVSRVKRSTKTK